MWMTLLDYLNIAPNWGINRWVYMRFARHPDRVIVVWIIGFSENDVMSYMWDDERYRVSIYNDGVNLADMDEVDAMRTLAVPMAWALGKAENFIGYIVP